MSSPKRMGRALMILAGLLVGTGLIVLFMINRQTPTHGETAPTIPTLTVIEVQPMPFRIEARGHGVARPAETWQAMAHAMAVWCRGGRMQTKLLWVSGLRINRQPDRSIHPMRPAVDILVLGVRLYPPVQCDMAPIPPRTVAERSDQRAWRCHAEDRTPATDQSLGPETLYPRACPGR